MLMHHEDALKVTYQKLVCYCSNDINTDHVSECLNESNKELVKLDICKGKPISCCNASSDSLLHVKASHYKC